MIPEWMAVVCGIFHTLYTMFAPQEIAASTAQLVIASRVKAKEGSNK